MEHRDVLDEKRLMALFNATRKADLRRILDDANIPYILGVRGSITTTVHAINAGLGVPMQMATIQEHPTNDELEFILRD